MLAAPAQAALPTKGTTYKGPVKIKIDGEPTKVGTAIVKVGNNRKRLNSFRVKIGNICGTKFDNTYEDIPVKDDGTFSYTNGPITISGEFLTKRKARGTFQEEFCASATYKWLVRAQD